MEFPSQRGSTLAESAVAVAIVAIIAGATFGATLTALHAAAGDPASNALQEAAARELRIALDVLKYSDATLAPASIATTVPMPTGSPMPAQVTLTTAAAGNGAFVVTVDAVASDGSGKRASLGATLDRRSVLPGAQVTAPGLAPAPTGAP
jgi:Tfp pilus assembly protein PilE